MNIIDLFIATPIGYLMRLCYKCIGNYGWTIVAFTVLVKLIMFPIGMMVQKNSIKMVKMQPLIEELKRKYPDKADHDRLMEEQIELFKNEKYSAGLGCLPMLIQIPIIIGIIYVVYNPLKHLLAISNETIAALESAAMGILNLESLGPSGSMTIIELIKSGDYTDIFANIASSNVLDAICGFDTSLLGVNLALVPSFSNGLVSIPILSGLSALILCIVQNRENVLQQEQGFWGKWGMSIFLVVFSLYFTFVVPAGVGVYWILSNVLAILQIYLLNIIYNPKKYIDYEKLAEMKETNAILKAVQKEKKQLEKKYAGKEAIDYKKFLSTPGKQLVFYSEKSGFYKYFENVIDELIDKSDIVIHYITSDPQDKIFEKETERIIPYYIGEKKLIPLFMKMDADMVVMTMPDLDRFHIKRSIVRKDIEYVYMFHAPLSFIMTIRDKALDNYDTIFATGKHQVKEIRESEKLYHLPPKTIIECGYGVIENMRKYYEDNRDIYRNKKRKTILIAPTWNEDNILDSCLDDILANVLHKDWGIIVRPHPEYCKRFPSKVKKLFDKYKDDIGEDFEIQTDFSSNETVYSADLLISDWSWIPYEYSLSTLKPSLFINTKMKVENPNWDKLPLTPLNLALRDKIGKQLEKDEINEKIYETIKYILDNNDEYETRIKAIEEEYVFNFGKSGLIGATYIISRLRGR